MKLLGRMASCTYVVQHARLRLHPLQISLAQVYKLSQGSLERIVMLPHQVLESLGWWLQAQVICGGLPFAKPQSSLQLVMDALALGWGAHLGSIRTQGMCSQAELSLHINVRELRAVRLACHAFQLIFKATVCWY